MPLAVRARNLNVRSKRKFRRISASEMWGRQVGLSKRQFGPRTESV
jgi:hypothetical protein